MERTMDAVLVEQCAPTLAGVKPASLFRCQAGEGRRPREAAGRWARELAPFGIAVRVLKECPRTGACLIYLYRAQWLRQILGEPANKTFLRQMGYETARAAADCWSSCLAGFVWNGNFPMRSVCFWDIPWRMW